MGGNRTKEPIYCFKCIILRHNRILMSLKKHIISILTDRKKNDNLTKSQF